MSDLANKKCLPCEIGGPSMPLEEAKNLLQELDSWEINNQGHLYKKFKFEDYKSALEFVNKVSEIAESEGHHPNVSFTWGLVEIELWAHAVKGLSENDFILASKIDQLT